MKNISNLDRFPHFLEKEKFQDVFNISALANLTEEQVMAYTENLQAKWDWESALSLAEERAAEKADKKARKEEGEKIEAEREKAEAEKIEATRVIRNTGALSSQQIADAFHLPLHVIEKL